jgi:hypothetical protein
LEEFLKLFRNEKARQEMAEEAKKIAARLESFRQPLPPTRPLLDALRRQLAMKENELSKARLACDRLTEEVRAFRLEVAWLDASPEFDSVYARLSEKPIESQNNQS